MQAGSFHYEQKDENFPEIGANRNNGASDIGKILSRYQFRSHHQHPHNNRSQDNSVHTGMALNYSQIYLDLKIHKNAPDNHNQEESQPSHPHKPTDKSHFQQDELSSSPYHFQSAVGIGSRLNKKKVLPGLIARTPRGSEQSNYEQAQSQHRASFQGATESVHSHNISFEVEKPVQKNRNFRISDVKDQNHKRINYQEVSDLYISDNDNDNEENQQNLSYQKAFKSQAIIKRKEIGKLTDKFRHNHISHQVNQQYQPIQKTTVQNSKIKDYQEQQQQYGQEYEQQQYQQYEGDYHKEQTSVKHLEQSRSVGVGNHIIKQEDLAHSYHEEQSMEKLPPTTEQIQEVFQKQIGNDRNLNLNLNNDKSKNKKIEQNTVHQREEERNIELQKIIVHYPEVDAVEHHPTAQQQQEMKHSRLEGISASRVASSIKAHENVEDELGDNLLKSMQIKQEQKIQQLQIETPQKIPEPSEYVSTFSLEQYMEVYPVLKTIQAALKASLINVQEMLRGIKRYLEIIAGGNLDNIDEFNLALHKKKIIKNALFLERVAIIILAFSYVTHTVKDSHKFLLNLVGYSLNNSLILIKVLQQTQIADPLVKSKIAHKKHQHQHQQTIQNSQAQADRLAMKRNLDTLRNNNDVLMDSIHKLSKCDETFSENLKQIVKLINKASLEQTFYNLLEYFAFYLSVNEVCHMIPFLAVAPNPYLAPTVANTGLKYTLVVDVLEIFCLGTRKAKSHVFRPYSQHFLHQMSQYYEIVSFTPAFPINVDKVIDMLDPKGYIQHRLYKHHAINKNKQSLKEIDRIGRDPDQILLLDNENGGGQGSYENCIHVPAWKGSKNDTILAELCPLLAMIALKRVKVPEAARKVREQTFKNRQNGVKYINFGVTLD